MKKDQQIPDHDLPPLLSDEDRLLAAMYNLKVPDEKNPMGPWYDMTEEQRWDHLWASNMVQQNR